MNNFNDFKTPLSWILGSFFVVYLCFMIVNHSQSENLFADNWNNTNDWHFDQLSTKIDNLIVDVSAGAEDSSLSLLSASDKILIVLINGMFLTIMLSFT